MMDAVYGSLLLLLALIVGIGGTLFYLGRRAKTALVMESNRIVVLPHDPPKPQCAMCAHFSLEAGQEEIRRNPAFAAALQAIPLWKMSRKREIDWHPEYAPLDKEMEEAIAAHDRPRMLEVQKKIDALEIDSYGKERNPNEYVPPEALAAKPQDFGVCALHSELRSQFDKCDRFTMKTATWEAGS